MVINCLNVIVHVYPSASFTFLVILNLIMKIIRHGIVVQKNVDIYQNAEVINVFDLNFYVNVGYFNKNHYDVYQNFLC